MRVSFDRFMLDTDERRFFDGGTEIHLAPKAFALLVLLIEERPKAISKLGLDALPAAAALANWTKTGRRDRGTRRSSTIP